MLNDYTNPDTLKAKLKSMQDKDMDYFATLVDKNMMSPETCIKFLKDSENLKECKWCKSFMKSDDDFCSPECLEKYAQEFLKKRVIHR